MWRREPARSHEWMWSNGTPLCLERDDNISASGRPSMLEPAGDDRRGEAGRRQRHCQFMHPPPAQRERLELARNQLALPPMLIAYGRHRTLHNVVQLGLVLLQRQHIAVGCFPAPDAEVAGEAIVRTDIEDQTAARCEMIVEPAQDRASRLKLPDEHERARGHDDRGKLAIALE